MSTTSGSLAEPGAQPTSSRLQATGASRRTVDAPTRAFHWLMALSFAGAYATAEIESLRLVHVTLGYSVAGLIVARLIWGLVGPRPTRLSSWAKRLQPLKTLGSGGLASLRPALGMLAIIGILLAGVATASSGIGLDQEWGGARWEDALEEWHEVAGNAMLLVVMGHLALLTIGLVLKGPAQMLSMITGRVRGAGPDLIKHNRAWLAGALVCAVMAFWTWQWQSAPSANDGGEAGATPWSTQGGHSHHDRRALGHDEADDDHDD